MVVGHAARRDLYDPERLYLLFRRSSLGNGSARRKARAGQQTAADARRHVRCSAVRARRGVAAAMVAESVRRSDLFPVSQPVAAEAVEDLWRASRSGRGYRSAGGTAFSVQSMAGCPVKTVVSALFDPLADPVRAVSRFRSE